MEGLSSSSLTSPAAAALADAESVVIASAADAPAASTASTTSTTSTTSNDREEAERDGRGERRAASFEEGAVAAAGRSEDAPPASYPNSPALVAAQAAMDAAYDKTAVERELEREVERKAETPYESITAESTTAESTIAESTNAETTNAETTNAVDEACANAEAVVMPAAHASVAAAPPSYASTVSSASSQLVRMEERTPFSHMSHPIPPTSHRFDHSSLFPAEQHSRNLHRDLVPSDLGRDLDLDLNLERDLGGDAWAPQHAHRIGLPDPDPHRYTAFALAAALFRYLFFARPPISPICRTPLFPYLTFYSVFYSASSSSFSR